MQRLYPHIVLEWPREPRKRPAVQAFVKKCRGLLNQGSIADLIVVHDARAPFEDEWRFGFPDLRSNAAPEAIAGIVAAHKAVNGHANVIVVSDNADTLAGANKFPARIMTFSGRKDIYLRLCQEIQAYAQEGIVRGHVAARARHDLKP